jgi:lysophospholipase L1-like esterase
MINILCYGDSNAWGNIAGSFNPDLMMHQRYEYGIRWTSQVQKILGAGYHFIEASLNGRTTSFDETDSVRPSRNGLATLPGILQMHYPLNLVIFMLGTNDFKTQFNASIDSITQGMRQLIHSVKTSCYGENYQPPQVMLISPAPIFAATPSFYLFLDDQSVEKSHQLAPHYEQLAKEEHCWFLDAKPFVTVSAKDGIHIEQDSHQHLAAAVAKKIKAFFEKT